MTPIPGKVGFGKKWSGSLVSGLGWLVITLLAADPVPVGAGEKVVLLHGLARTSRSMVKMEKALIQEGFDVLNLEYPSRQLPIEDLAKVVRENIIEKVGQSKRVHFVTHSMGGIILRYIQSQNPIKPLARVVMISPPNQGSEVVDTLGSLRIFKYINGPAGSQLGTQTDGFISGLGPVDFELGVITGDRSVNWILSWIIPGKDDGKVSIESARVEGMNDFRVIHATHPFIMKNKHAIREVIAFLKTGKFTAVVE